MNDHQHTDGPRPSREDCLGERCGLFRPGHLVHSAQTRQASLSPWHWRDAIVVGIHGLDVRLRYVEEDHEFSIWHHGPLGEWLSLGDPVAVHERFYLLLAGDTGFCIHITDGLGPVPEPRVPWPGPVLVTELATGHVRGGWRE